MNLIYLTGLLGVFLIGLLAWRQAVVGSLVLAVFEGALRKWVFPEAHQWVYLGKDMLLLGAYAGFLVRRPAVRERPLPAHPATAPLVALGLLTLAQLANPSLPSFQVGLFGIRSYLIYVPLLYVVSAVFPHPESLRKFWNRYLVLAVVPLTLGILQFGAPPGSVLNRYAWQDETTPSSIAVLAGYGPRVTGTFSYISGYTVYLRVLFLVGLSTLLWGPKTPLSRLLWIFLGGVLANIWMTGSRGVLILLAASALILVLLIFRLQGQRGLRSVVLMCVGLPIITLMTERVFPEAYQGFLERTWHTQDTPGRIAGIVTGPLWALNEAGLFGYGVGSTHQALAFLAPDASPVPPAEGELERIVLELGPLGLMLVLWARFLVTLRLWRAVWASRGTPLQPYVVIAFLYSLMSWPGPLMFNHTAHLFYWFMAGTALISVKKV
ncbi:MAG: hypothetical protein NZ742_07425 [Acidobacteria bacterium]|nr:hypothetical protein [Acidobacteriota bacterium]MDW7984649.1 hypothetical protein [Acidobacteriota bacterium]